MKPVLKIWMLLSMLDEGTREWREELGEIPKEAITWQPFPNAHSIGGVILHIMEVEAFWIHEVAPKEALTEEQLTALMADLTDVDEVKWPLPPDEPLAWYWDQCDQVRARSREIIKDFADPQTLRTLPIVDREYSLRWILYHVLAHEAYHGGQAVLLSVMHGRIE